MRQSRKRRGRDNVRQRPPLVTPRRQHHCLKKTGLSDILVCQFRRVVDVAKADFAYCVSRVGGDRGLGLQTLACVDFTAGDNCRWVISVVDMCDQQKTTGSERLEVRREQVMSPMQEASQSTVESPQVVVCPEVPG